MGLLFFRKEPIPLYLFDRLAFTQLYALLNPFAQKNLIFGKKNPLHRFFFLTGFCFTSSDMYSSP